MDKLSWSKTFAHTVFYLLIGALLFGATALFLIDPYIFTWVAIGVCSFAGLLLFVKHFGME